MPQITLRRRPIPKRDLMGHQQSCLDWVWINKIKDPAFFMEMRLGKTLTAIRTTTDIWKCQDACLVAAPITVLEAWEKELYLEGESYRVAHGKSRKERIEIVEWAFKSKGRKWVLINYDSLRSMPAIGQLPWDAVFLDESTIIKNPAARITKLCVGGFRRAKHRCILSGLPRPEGDLDLFSQFQFLNGKFLGFDSFFKFRSAMFEPGDGIGQSWKPKIGTSLRIKDEVYRNAFVMRRQDAGMPNRKIRETRTIPMREEQKEAYKQVEKEFAMWIDENTEYVELEDGFVEQRIKETEHVIVQQTWLHRISGGCDAEGNFRWNNKIKELVDVVKGELYDQPVVVWFRFNSEIAAAQAAFDKAGISCRNLTGADNRDKRKQVFDWFRTSKVKGRVLLLQIKLAKYGVDVSVSDTAIYYSMTFSCEDIAQSEDRIFHPKKDCSLLYLYLVSENSVDGDVLYAVRNKVTNAKMFMTRFKESFDKRKQPK